MKSFIGTAQLLRSTAGHEVVHGTTGSGKTTRVKKLLAEDKANGREAWVIDPQDGMSLPEWDGKASRFATDLGDAWALLGELLDIARYDAFSHPPLTVTIETAQNVFGDRSCRRLAEKTLDKLDEVGGDRIRFRVVVNTLDLGSFGYSETIRSALTDGAEAVA